MGRNWEAPQRVVAAIGMDHAPGFVVDRPHGSGDWAFICFRVPARLRWVAGRQAAQPGDCIFYAPSSPTWYTGDGVGLDNDWMRLAAKGFGDLLAYYDLPVARLFHPVQVGFIAPLVAHVQQEALGKRPHWQEACGLLVEELVLRLSRAVHLSLPSDLTLNDVEHFGSFLALRARLLQHLDRAWTVREMAAEVNLSAPRFAVLYRRFFQVSPLQDLIEARLALARELLANSDGAIAGIALRCGFQSVSHFSRFFRARVGHSPRDWRQANSI